MKKLWILVLAISPILLLAGCGQTPKEKAAGNVAKEGLNFLKEMGELGQAHEDGKLTDKELQAGVSDKLGDSLGNVLDGTDDALTNTEKKQLKDDVNEATETITDKDKLSDMIDEAAKSNE